MPDFESQWFTDLLGRAIHGPELPDYAGVPDSGPREKSAGAAIQ
jgi:hypothetical protein